MTRLEDLQNTFDGDDDELPPNTPPAYRDETYYGVDIAEDGSRTRIFHSGETFVPIGELYKAEKEVAAALSERDDLRRQLAQMAGVADSGNGNRVDLERERARTKRLEAALGFYCDPLNWENETVDIGVGDMPIPFSSPAVSDSGGRARAAALDDIARRVEVRPDGPEAQ